jgi:hypothetical protein
VLEWFEGLGYTVAHGPDIAVDGSKPERLSYADVLLIERLRTAPTNSNPTIPPDAIEDAISKILTPSVLLAAWNQSAAYLSCGPATRRTCQNL